MKTFQKIIEAAPFLGFAVLLALSCSIACAAQLDSLRSSDGKYVAEKTRGESGIHFRIKEVKGSRVVLTTHAQFPSPNDVKVGRFSPDSPTLFAAAYHYGHEGKYTWIGVWNLKDGDLVWAVEVKEWVSRIPNSVFDEPEK